MDLRIIDVNTENIEQYPPACFLNPKNAGCRIKCEWLEKRFLEGLKIKFLYSEKDGKMHGFIEYVPGEYAWRAVEASDYIFIHCIWVSPNSYKNMGNGSLLIQECESDSRGKRGIAVVTSDGPFMAGKDIFLENGFKAIVEDGSYQLLVKQFSEGPLPQFKDYRKRLQAYDGLHIVYSNQCPWVARFVSEMDKDLVTGLKMEVTELQTAKEAQKAPSIYSVFNLVYNGKLLSDHYISNTRFSNIIKKVIKT